MAAAGLSVNQFMTVMLKGPEYKQRRFAWRFSPQSEQETNNLKFIIRLLNNSMAPSLAGIGSAFWAWPKILKPKFVHSSGEYTLMQNTYGMKPSVITDFSVNYTPNGNFSPFARTRAPTSVDLMITLMELEFWLAGDFNDTNATTNSQGSSWIPWVNTITQSDGPGVLDNPGNIPPVDSPL